MAQTITPYCTTIYWEDTDASGIVYHANYVRFLERARSEWAREMGINQETLRDKEHRALVVANLTIDFKRPAKLDDSICVKSTLVGLKAASLVLEQAIFRGTELLIHAKVRLGFVSTETGHPVAFSKDFMTLFTPYLNKEEQIK